VPDEIQEKASEGKKMKYRLIFFCFIFLFTVIGGIMLPAQGIASEPVVIGISQWKEFPYADMMKNSFEMALEEINKGGGIKGRPLKLMYADDQGQRGAGEKTLREFRKNGTVMAVGGYSSNNTIYTARAADKADIPFLICTAADDRITQRKWENVFRLNPPASDYTKGLEDFFLSKVKPRSLAIIYENSPYGTGSALRMMWFCREQGIEIRKIIPYHKERMVSSYLEKLVEPLKANPPDVIYMVSYLRDGVELVKKIRNLKINTLLCGGAGGFTHQKFLAAAGEAGENLLTATLWFHELKYPGTKEYYEQYVKTHSAVPDYHGAEAYSALLVAADALGRAKSHSPGDIRAALRDTDMNTPFGPVKFASYKKFSRQNRLPTAVLQIINGKFESIWPGEMATSAFVAPSGWRR